MATVYKIHTNKLKPVCDKKYRPIFKLIWLIIHYQIETGPISKSPLKQDFWVDNLSENRVDLTRVELTTLNTLPSPRTRVLRSFCSEKTYQDSLERIFVTGKTKGKIPRERSPISWCAQIRTILETPFHATNDRKCWKDIRKNQILSKHDGHDPQQWEGLNRIPKYWEILRLTFIILSKLVNLNLELVNLNLVKLWTHWLYIIML